MAESKSSLLDCCKKAHAQLVCVKSHAFFGSGLLSVLVRWRGSDHNVVFHVPAHVSKLLRSHMSMLNVDINTDSISKTI